MIENFLIRRFTPQDSDAVIGLMQQQDERLHGLDGRCLVTYKTKEQ